MRIGVARVEAERLRSTDSAAAGQLLWDAGQHALANEELYSGVLAADESFMLNPNPEAGGFLELLRDRSALVAAFADRATAMLDGDPLGLAAAAELLERLVQPGRAAHAWRAAASLHARRGESEAARRCERASARLVTDWRVTTWPDVARESQRLTARELEIATLAADRWRSREIAEHTGLSVRTVDNHLASTFRKLGIGGRDELASALGRDPS